MKTGDNIGNSGLLCRVSADYAKGYNAAFKFMKKNGILYADDDVILSKKRNTRPEEDGYTVFVLTIPANQEAHTFVLTDKQKANPMRVVANNEVK